MIQPEGQLSVNTKGKSTLTLILKGDLFYPKCGETSKLLHKRRVKSQAIVDLASSFIYKS